MTGRLVRARFGLLAAVLLATTACGSGGGDRGTLTVRLDGAELTMLVAGRDGMRGRSDFGDASGMLFDHGREIDPLTVAWVMDGVPIALDIAWFDAAGRFVGRTTMEPCAAEPCPHHRPDVPYRRAIEAPAGALGGLSPTSTLELVP